MNFEYITIDQLPIVLTTKDVSSILKIDESEVEQLITKNKISVIQGLTKKRITGLELINFLNSNGLLDENLRLNILNPEGEIYLWDVWKIFGKKQSKNI